MNSGAKSTRFSVRLVNSGLPVWIATLGDTFFQQMINLVKALSFDENALSRLDPEPEESIRADRVSAYSVFRRELNEAPKRMKEVRHGGA